MKRTIYRSGAAVFLGALIVPVANLGCRSTTPEISAIKPIRLVVDANGSGQFTIMQPAIMSVPAGSHTKPVVIHIKPGTYQELVYLHRDKRFFKLVGADPVRTVITYDLSAILTNM